MHPFDRQLRETLLEKGFKKISEKGYNPYPLRCRISSINGRSGVIRVGMPRLLCAQIGLYTVQRHRAADGEEAAEAAWAKEYGMKKPQLLCLLILYIEIQNFFFMESDNLSQERRCCFLFKETHTFPQTNSSPLNMGRIPKGK